MAGQVGEKHEGPFQDTDQHQFPSTIILRDLIGQMLDDGSDLFLREQWIQTVSFHALHPVRKACPPNNGSGTRLRLRLRSPCLPAGRRFGKRQSVMGDDAGIEAGKLEVRSSSIQHPYTRFDTSIDNDKRQFEFNDTGPLPLTPDLTTTVSAPNSNGVHRACSKTTISIC